MNAVVAPIQLQVAEKFVTKNSADVKRDDTVKVYFICLSIIDRI